MKLDEEPGLALRYDAMQDLGHDDPQHAGLEESLAGQRQFDDVAQPTGEHVDHAPDTGLRRMIPSQPVRDRELIEVARALVGDVSALAVIGRLFATQEAA